MIFEKEGFILLSSLDKEFVISLVYATEDNFLKRKLYSSDACVLRSNTALKLARANEILNKQGFKIKIFDAYRPFSIQKIFWDILPDNNFVANPNTGGSIHNRGCAVDVTLVKLDGSDVLMPSSFDDFTIAANRNNPDMNIEAKNNLEILTNAMVASGFNFLEEEWWHFTDTDYKDYNVVDLDLSIFKNI